ncbi:MAG TPA: PrsW family glutamic-type intramembrane protease [Candidatus Paceibacterota bacterium]|nr:PrsW family glutamic-type intramembrane protease [Candidatus Paceibacterota bacterium]
MANQLGPELFLYAALGGMLPPLLWLWFWLHEDDVRPEPRGMIMLTFISGMVAVPIAIFFEEMTQRIFPLLSSSSPFKIILWAAIEEILKYLSVRFGAFETGYFDEPIDAVMYMMTAALGFAALENTFFLLSVLRDSGFVEWFATGNARFLGATVLHTVSSSLVGAAVGFTFYRSKWVKVVAVLIGLTTATLLHSAFNFFIIQSEGKNIMEVFFVLWMIAILAMIIFEKVRNTRPKPERK